MDPHCNGLNSKLENVLKRAARFMTRNYSRETGSMTCIFEELKRKILQLRKGGRINKSDKPLSVDFCNVYFGIRSSA